MASSLNVLPYFATLDVAYETSRYSVISGDLPMQSSICTDLQNGGFCKFCHAAARAARFSASSLGKHIGRVVGVRSKKQMIGVDAGRHVATMTNEQFSGDWAIGNDPGKAMGFMRGALPRQNSIAPAIAITLPKAASIWAIFRMSPKTLVQGFCHHLSYNRRLFWRE